MSGSACCSTSELAWRDNKRLERLRKQAKLKYAGACLEDLDRRQGRGLDERQLATLASGTGSANSTTCC